jgi:hypothetical protein
MKKTTFILIFLINLTAYAQEADDQNYLDKGAAQEADGQNYSEDEYFDFGVAEDIKIYGARPKEYDSKSIDAYVLDKLNGSLSDRKQFIETEFLEESGFRRTGNVKYHKTNGAEKTASIFSHIGYNFSLGFIPVLPLFEIEHDRLPKGEFYKFESVFIKSNFTNVTPEILTIMELEYILQIEFCNGILMQNNKNYYTEENIDKFDRLIHRLPDSTESVHQVKNRYLIESQKIKAALERYRNPDENYLRALQNLGDIFNMNRNR